MRNATISPEMKVNPATVQNAPARPSMSAVTPAINAPTVRSPIVVRQKIAADSRHRSPRCDDAIPRRLVIASHEPCVHRSGTRYKLRVVTIFENA